MNEFFRCHDGNVHGRKGGRQSGVSFVGYENQCSRLGDGEIAPVVRDKDGFRIFKVLGRTSERTYTFDEAREELKNVIEQEKLQVHFMEYIEGLKEIYYVEIKEDR